MKILVVEDDRPLAASLQTLLEDRGYEVECAYDGETGAQYARLGVYDLMILDVMLPKLDGRQVARQLRAERCAVPILMLTARSGLEDRVEGLDAGADYYLAKPFDTRELLACVNALLRRQGGAGGRAGVRQHVAGPGFLHLGLRGAMGAAVRPGVRRDALLVPGEGTQPAQRDDPGPGVGV